MQRCIVTVILCSLPLLGACASSQSNADSSPGTTGKSAAAAGNYDATPEGDDDSSAPERKVDDGGSTEPRRPERDGGDDEPRKPDRGEGSAGSLDHASSGSVPRGFEKLGSPCEAKSTAPNPDDQEYCGPNGVIAGVFVPVDMTDKAPPPGSVHFQAKVKDDGNQDPSLDFAHAGERLWIRHVTCGSCRRVLGWAFLGDLPAMAEPQVRDLQNRLNVASDVPPLTNATAWKRQFAGAR